MNLRVPYKAGNFLTSWVTVSFWRRTLLHVVQLVSAITHILKDVPCVGMTLQEFSAMEKKYRWNERQQTPKVNAEVHTDWNKKPVIKYWTAWWWWYIVTTSTQNKHRQGSRDSFPDSKPTGVKLIIHAHLELRSRLRGALPLRQNSFPRCETSPQECVCRSIQFVFSLAATLQVPETERERERHYLPAINFNSSRQGTLRFLSSGFSASHSRGPR
jgi:hypothetical protein